MVAGRKTRRLAGKKFPPQKPLHFLPARRNFLDNFPENQFLIAYPI